MHRLQPPYSTESCSVVVQASYVFFFDAAAVRLQPVVRKIDIFLSFTLKIKWSLHESIYMINDIHKIDKKTKPKKKGKTENLNLGVLNTMVT